jgi:adenylate cyclase
MSLPLLLPFFLMIALGGFVNSSGVVLWSLSSPMGAMVFTERHQAMRWFLAFLALVILGAILEPFVQTTSHLPTLMRTIFFVMNIGCTSTVAFVLVQYFVNQKETTLNLLHVEQAKSEHLLLNILPEAIARRLKEGEESIADSYASASILFVDIVGFTPMSAKTTPKEMVLFLSELFSCFDQLVEKHHAEKIETIGDSYMVAVGLPVLRADHAQVIASLALDIQAYLESGVYLNGQVVNCRIGINSGPLMAGVIGRKKISYDVWGDTVNVASRMESHGIPGQIQISETTYALIKESFHCEPRELINVKGKGLMQTYLLKHRL